LTWAASAKRG